MPTPISLSQLAIWRVTTSPALLGGLSALTLGVALAVVSSIAAVAQPLPPDTIAWTMTSYSIAKDRAGAAVRSEPAANAKILGRLAPPQKATEDDQFELAVADAVWRTEFQVIGFLDGWFLIEKALHPNNAPIGAVCWADVQPEA